MLDDESSRQPGIGRLISFGEHRTLKGAIASVGALCRFFASIEDQMKQAEQKE